MNSIRERSNLQTWLLAKKEFWGFQVVNGIESESWAIPYCKRCWGQQCSLVWEPVVSLKVTGSDPKRGVPAVSFRKAYTVTLISSCSDRSYGYLCKPQVVKLTWANKSGKGPLILFSYELYFRWHKSAITEISNRQCLDLFLFLFLSCLVLPQCGPLSF